MWLLKVGYEVQRCTRAKLGSSTSKTATGATMTLFKRHKTDAELQAELKALVYRCLIQPTTSLLDRYQEILEEMFNRGIEPESTLKPVK